jgi:RNA polymerase-binding transcription factor DksA
MADLSAIKARLQDKLQELQARVSAIEAHLSTPGDSDSTENAVESEDDEVLDRIESVTESEIREVQLALQRLAAGQYGQCAVCGKGIGTVRLTALPYATRCIDCA